MQEEVEQRLFVLSTSAAKMTGRVLAGMMKKYLQLTKKGVQKAIAPQGKQTLKQLSKKDAGLSNIEITDKNIGSFSRIARKFKVDFALKRSKSNPTKYYVFFKGRDQDAITAAFTEYTAKVLKAKEKPSLLNRLSKLKERAAAQPVMEQVKKKVVER